MLTIAAFNALLKTLEEPPAHVKFIFATTDPEKLLPTILSRCQRFDLRRIPIPLIVEHLGRIARQEKVELDEAALHAIARGADGGMRDAQSTLDQLISFCGGRIVEADVLSMFGLASRSQLLALAEAVLTGDLTAALRLLDELARGGKDLGRLLGDLLSHFRNLLLLELSDGDRRLIEVSDLEWMALQTQSKQVDAATLGRVLEVFSTAESRLRDSPSKRIFLEVTLLKAVEARNSVSLESVLQQLKSLREGTGEPRPAAPSAAVRPTSPPPTAATEPPVSPRVSPPAAAPASASLAASPAPVETPSVVAAAVTPPPPPSPPAPPEAAAPVTAESLWSALYASLERTERMLWTLLAGSEARSWAQSTLTVACPPDALELAGSGKSAALLRAKLRELVPGDATLKFVPGEAKAPAIDLAASEVVRPKPSAPRRAEAKPDKPQPLKLNKEEFLADPLIQEAMALFRAQLVEVRAPSEGSL